MRHCSCSRRLAVGAALALAPVLALGAADTVPRDGVFIHISHGPDQAHRVLMPLRMAKLMADGHDVLVYLDVEGVRVALKDTPGITLPPHFESSRALLEALVAKGVTVMVCPTCLKVAGKSESDLLPGVKLADKERFFSFTKGRIITLDY